MRVALAPKCWGLNATGQLGIGSTTPINQPDPIDVSTTFTDWTSITAGSARTCALRSGGQVFCWGNNNAGGAIGDGTTTSPRPSPTAVAGLPAATHLSSALDYNCAVSGGEVWCWGVTPLGNQSSATKVAGVSGVTQVAAGSAHACALKSDSSVICWGSNSLDQLGTGNTVLNGANVVPANGSPASSSTPITVKIQPTAGTTATLTGVVAISAGSNHSCALLSGGAVRCWGDNNNGVLGNTSSSPWPTWPSQTGAVLVDGLSGASQITSGQNFNCALLSDATVRCWGDNASGQLGDNSKEQRKTPVNPGLTNVTAISAGNTHTCALLGSGDIYCWGANTQGQIGDGTTTERLTPVATSAGAAFWR